MCIRDRNTGDNSVGPSEPKKVEKTRGATEYEDHHPLTDPDYNPESTKRNRSTNRWTGEKGNRKLTKPTAIQKKLIKAGHSEENLVKLMINYKNKYKDKRGW